MKHVFVTVGSTLFDDLIKTVTSAPILQALNSMGYTSMQIQYGIGQAPSIPECTAGISITTFNLLPSLADAIAKADLIIGHAVTDSSALIDYFTDYFTRVSLLNYFNAVHLILFLIFVSLWMPVNSESTAP